MKQLLLHCSLLTVVQLPVPTWALCGADSGAAVPQRCRRSERTRREDGRLTSVSAYLGGFWCHDAIGVAADHPDVAEMANFRPAGCHRPHFLRAMVR